MPASAPISVVIPARNAARTIAATLGSLASERDLLCEIILVDDLSSDGTAERALTAAREFDLPLRVVAASAGDPGAARNIGLEASRGAWLYFIDADDLHVPGGLRALLAVAGRRAGTGLVTGAHRRHVDGRPRRWKWPAWLGASAARNARRYLTAAIRSFPIGSVIVARPAIGAHRFPEGIAYDEDTLFWTAVLTGAKAARSCRSTMTYNVVTRRSDDRFTLSPVGDYLRWRRAMRPLAALGLSSDALKRRAGVVALKIARVHYARADYPTARRFLAVARAAPKSPRDAWRCLRYRLKVAIATRRRFGGSGRR